MTQHRAYQVTLLLLIVLTCSGCSVTNDGDNKKSGDDSEAGDTNSGTWDNMRWDDDSWS